MFSVSIAILDGAWAVFWSRLFATVIGGMLLTFFFFLLREKVFPHPAVSGRWFVEMETVKTSHEPYEGMILGYLALIWREGREIHGTIEKIYENSSTGERSYEGENRTRGVVEGSVEKNYFSADRLVLHVVEDGHGRESTHFHVLTLESETRLKGEFSSMVRNQDGNVTWQRDIYADWSYGH